MIPVEACYPWMFRSTTDETNLSVLLDVRAGVEGLRELSGTFRMSEITDYNSTVVPEPAMWLLGSWRLPEEYDSQKAKRYVNPNYVHRGTYADIYVRCECGAKMINWRGNEHGDDCQQGWRVSARERLYEAREVWVRRAARLTLTAEDAGPRMGLSGKSLWRFCDNRDIDWMAHRRRGRRRAIWTWRKLHDEYGHTYADIARAFGYSPSAVRSYCNGHGNNIKP